MYLGDTSCRVVRGPLLSEDGKQLLVKAHSKISEAALYAIEKYGNPIRILLAILAAALVILVNLNKLGL